MNSLFSMKYILDFSLSNLDLIEMYSWNEMELEKWRLNLKKLPRIGLLILWFKYSKKMDFLISESKTPISSEVFISLDLIMYLSFLNQNVKSKFL